MGRYWSTNSFEGKFGFALQNSSDFYDYFDCELTNDADTYCELEYTGKPEPIIKKLNGLYEFVGLPAEYPTTFESNQELEDYVWKDLYERRPDNFAPADIRLALYRIWCGHAVLSDLLTDGYCHIVADY